MGMFDSIICKKALPDIGVRPDIDFQTKDMDCLLTTYTITEDGHLLVMGEDDISGDLCDFTGLLHFYTYENKEFIGYMSLFNHGLMMGSFHRVTNDLRIGWCSGYDYIKLIQYPTYRNATFAHPKMPIGHLYRGVATDVDVNGLPHVLLQDTSDWNFYAVPLQDVKDQFTLEMDADLDWSCSSAVPFSENERRACRSFTEWLQQCHGSFLGG